MSGKQKIFLTLDFETFYAPKYEIKHMGISQYVADERFGMHSVGLKTLDAPRARAFGGPEAVARVMAKLRANQDRIVLCGHNLYFDAYVAYYHYNFTPAYMVDTLCMAQVLHAHDGPLDLDFIATEHYGREGKIKGVLDYWKGLRWEDATLEQRQELLHYNERDVEETEGIALEMIQQFPRMELDTIDLTLRMFVDPKLRVDEDLAKEILKEERKKKEAAAKSVGAKESQLRSIKQFAALLEERGYEVPEKWSEKQEKMIPALAKNDLPYQRMEKSDDPQLSGLIKARVTCNSSITETRAKGLIARADRKLPIGLMYASAHTLRWGGTDKINPQNLPREGRLRHCLMADDGYALVIVDASQIEARDNATFSEQWDLVEEFAAGVDVYSSFASDLYGFEVSKKNAPDERFVGKTSILGLGYQMGALRFQNTLETGMMGPPVVISFEEAQRAVNLYRRKYYRIKEHWALLQSLIPHMLDEGNEIDHRGIIIKPGGKVLMPNGLHLYYPGLTYGIHPEFGTPEFEYWPYDKQYKTRVPKKLYGGLFLENLVQCRSRIMTTEHMLKLSKYYRVVLMAHDEIVFHVPVSHADRCLSDSIEVMSEPPRWNELCPLSAEGRISDHYIKD